MENNNPSQTPLPSTPNVVQPPMEGNHHERNMLILLLVGGLIVVILVVTGVFWYLNLKQTGNKPAPKATSQPTKTDNSLDNLNKEINSVNVPSLESDFTSIDQDLQGL